MKKFLRAALAVMIITLCCAATALAANVADEYGNEFFPSVNAQTQTASVYCISLGSEATQMAVPETVEENGVAYPVTAFTGSASSIADMTDITFPDTLRTLDGNLFDFRQTVSAATSGWDTISQFKTHNAPDTASLLAALPAFITENYVDGAYYAGKTLVRVDPDYSGNFTVKDGTICVLASAFEGCTGIGKVALPSSVEFIGMRAFANSSVTSVNLPAGLAENTFTADSMLGSDIPYQAFYGCTSLTTVKIDSGCEINWIGYMAFYGCTKLTSLDFSKVGCISDLAFANCSSLKTADLTSTRFYNDGNIFAPFAGCTSLTSVTFGEDTGSTIPFECFTSCSRLASVSLTSSQTAAGVRAFDGCTALRSIDLKALQLLQYRSFAATSLSSITIPESVTNIDGAVFAECPRLKTMNWYAGNCQTGTAMFAILNHCKTYGVDPDNTMLYCATPSQILVYGGDYYCSAEGEKTPFDTANDTFLETLNIYAPTNNIKLGQQPKLKTVNYKYEVSSIGSWAFFVCPNLSSVTFSSPESLKSIGYCAFNRNIRLTSFPFNELTGLETIGGQAFAITDLPGSCAIPSYLVEGGLYYEINPNVADFGLRSLDLTNCTSLTTIGSGAFFNQFSAADVKLPSSLTLVESDSFMGTASVKNVEINCPLSALPYSASFMNLLMCSSGSSFNTNVKSITINGDGGTLPSDAFFRMTGLETVTINAPISTIPERCFIDCTGLKSVTLPDETTRIDTLAFLNCTSLEEVSLKSGISYGSQVFYKCTGLKNIVAESGVTYLSDFMFEGCTSLESISLPDTLTSIGWGTFKNSGFSGATVTIPASVNTIEDDAFANSSVDKIVLLGNTYINTSHSGGIKYLPDNTLLPLPASAALYYTPSAQTAVSSYSSYVNDTSYTPTALANSTGADFSSTKITVTGAPESVKAGSKLNTSGMTVTLTIGNTDIVLTKDQYTLDYSSADKTTGSRYVRVDVPYEILEDALPTETPYLLGAPVHIDSALIYGASSNGSIYSVVEDSGSQTIDFESGFTVNVTSGGGGGGGGSSSTTVDVPVHSGEGQINAGASVSGSTASVIISDKQLEQIISSSGDTGSVTVDLSGLGNVNSAKLPASLISAADNDADGIELVLPTGGVKLDSTALSSVSSGSDVTVSVNNVKTDDLTDPQRDILGSQLDSALVVDVSVLINGSKVTDFGGGSVTVSIPYTPKDGEDVSKLTVWYLKDDGAIENVGGHYDSAKGCFVFTTTHLSLYALISFPFDDVADSAYYYDAVAWAVNGGVTTGTSDSAFSPDETCTRAQTVTFLWRSMGSPEPTVTDNPFDDVSSDAYYYNAILWAVEKGITVGTSDTAFSPDATVTRAQTVTFLYRAAGKPDGSSSVSFTDVDDDAYYAEAVSWAYGKGITTGTSDTAFSPDDGCTRAQIVTFLYRYLGK